MSKIFVDQGMVFVTSELSLHKNGEGQGEGQGKDSWKDDYSIVTTKYVYWLHGRDPGEGPWAATFEMTKPQSSRCARFGRPYNFPAEEYVSGRLAGALRMPGSSVLFPFQLIHLHNEFGAIRIHHFPVASLVSG